MKLLDGYIYKFTRDCSCYYGRYEKENDWFSIANTRFEADKCNDIILIGIDQHEEQDCTCKEDRY